MTTNGRATIRVLIVDDMAQVRKDLRQALSLISQASEERIEITGEAGNGEEAIRQVEKLDPDVVLMDLGMPGMDGWTASRQIKLAHPHIRVIALTVHGHAEARRKAELAGIDIFLEKGLPLIEIVQAIVK